ncbi:MAG: alkaline phosphatase family protein, partial [Ignavibacteriae bacterium]|nr:alkaline phosphatase family protein [Ignavibacteriota bacterium]
YESGGNGLGRTFPHRVSGDSTSGITSSYYWALLTSPFGSEVLSEFARHTIVGEQLGQRGVTDLLCVGFSSTDYVGHSFGPHSHEVMDMTVRMDRILAEFFAFIDTTVGLNNCLIVLTSDHGVTPIPEYILKQNEHASAGRVMERPLKEFCTRALTSVFGSPSQSSWVDAVVSGNVYLNREALREKQLPLETAARTVADSLATMEAVAAAFTRSEMMTAPHSSLQARMNKSFHTSRSGDVFFALKPFYIAAYSETGTTHGEPYDYDAHVPVIFVGNGLKAGTYSSEASPADIAATLSSLVGIEFPAGREGRVLAEGMQVR